MQVDDLFKAGLQISFFFVVFFLRVAGITI